MTLILHTIVEFCPQAWNRHRPTMRSLAALDDELLLLIAVKLDPTSLALLSCTCKCLRRTASADHLWKRLATERWQFLNWPESDDVTPVRNFRELYSSNNGWTHDRLHKEQLSPSFAVMTFHQASAPHPAETNTVYILDHENLQIWDPVAKTSCCTVLPNHYTELTTLSQGMLAAAGIQDAIHVLSAPSEAAGVQIRGTWPQPANW